ncbi:hypothetical protein LSM04_005327 [Trypanosoma melophagium]|uniref:uncharacterized protein n=1 Tax=Trypanosoma melophagium TaxID=715481 RepID=UPI00351A9E17|nr:hypothetical protein LSM04_007076 [Trypanosoma melophagium]KAH9586147.1 hypothetical protein LSM04_005327 [Trypanosoma melophagium]
MASVSASHGDAAVTVGNDAREAFINYGGAYWLNPVPRGVSHFRTTCTKMKASDAVDPFGNPKQPDMPDLFGKSRYGTTDTRLQAAPDGTVDANAAAAGGEGDAKGTGEGGPTGKLNPSVLRGSGAHDSSAAVSGVPNGNKEPYSTEDLVREKLPLDTADPERRLLHPGNNAERIPLTGGSEYNGTVNLTWTAPKAVDNTYLRLAPLYESTTHYQLRTGLFYTEDEAPPHEMTLPLKSSLSTREW